MWNGVILCLLSIKFLVGGTQLDGKPAQTFTNILALAVLTSDGRFLSERS